MREITERLDQLHKLIKSACFLVALEVTVLHDIVHLVLGLGEEHGSACDDELCVVDGHVVCEGLSFDETVAERVEVLHVGSHLGLQEARDVDLQCKMKEKVINTQPINTII